MLIALAAVGLIVVVLFWALHAFAKPFVADKIAQSLAPEAPELYRVSMNRLSLQQGSSVFVEDLLVVPDTTLLTQLDSSAIPPRLVWLQLDYFEVSLQSVVGAVFGRSELSLNGLQIRQAELKIREIHQKSIPTDSENTESEVFINDLVAEDFGFWHQQLGDTSWNRASLKYLELTCRFSHRNSGGVTNYDLHQESLNLAVDEVAFIPQGGLYNIRMEQLRAGGDTSVYVAGFTCEPRYDKDVFQEYIPYQADRIDAHLSAVSCYGLAWNPLLNKGSVELDFIHFEPGQLTAYRDRNTPFDESQRPKLPVRLIRELPVAVAVDSMLIEQLDIEYQEKPEGQTVVAVVPFKRLSAQFYNITNSEAKIADDSLMVVRARTYLFGDPTLSAEFRYNLSTLNGEFWVEGMLTGFDMTLLNRTLHPLLDVSLDAGRHEHTSFTIHGNDFSASGKIEMQYHNLTVGTGFNNGISRFAGDALAKSFLYYKENPKSGKMRIGVFEEERDTKKFVFNFWWLLYKSGIKKTVLR